MKDKRLTPKQIERLLANNPKKIVVEPEPVETLPQTVSFKGGQQNYDSLDVVNVLKNFCLFIRDVVARYDDNVRKQEEAETMEMDLEHCIELAEKLTEKEKKTLYNKLTDVLQTRRACKSENEILQPLYNYFNDKVLMNKLNQIQGTAANVKDIISNRTYSCRTGILEDFRKEV